MEGRRRKPVRPLRCAHPWFNFLGFAWFLYLAGAIGYLVISIMDLAGVELDDRVWVDLNLAMAAIYMFDAVLYFLAWVVDTQNRISHGFAEHLVWDGEKKWVWWATGQKD